MYGTKARNSSTRPAFNLIALLNRFENAQVHRSSVKTWGSSCGYCARMEACSLCSLSCIDAVACLAGEPSKYNTFVFGPGEGRRDVFHGR